MLLNKDTKNLVTDLYHIGDKSYIDFKIPAGYAFGQGSLKMEEERTNRALILSKFYYSTSTLPADNMIIIRCSGGIGKIWSGGQRSEVIGVATMCPQGNLYQFSMYGDSGDHVDIDPFCQQFTLSFTNINNQSFTFDSSFLVQLSILDN